MNHIPSEFCQIGPGSWLETGALPPVGDGLGLGRAP